MIPLLAALALLLQSPHGADTVLMFTRDGPDSALVERTRNHPDDARDALRRLLAAAAGGAPLAPAERLAGAYAVAWRDSFFVRQVARFRALSPADRVAKVAADTRSAGESARNRATC